LPFFLHAVLDVLPRFGPIFCAIFWRCGVHYIGVLIAVVWHFFSEVQHKFRPFPFLVSFKRLEYSYTKP
jgi:hypothetical protein